MGIDVCKLRVVHNGDKFVPVKQSGYDTPDWRIVAKVPTFEALMEAIRQNQAEVEQQQLKSQSPLIRVGDMAGPPTGA
jgi:hypothetical protein